MDNDSGLAGPNENVCADESGWKEPAIDLRQYLPGLASIDASEAQKIELLETLCAILRACIELQLSGDTYIDLINAIEKASQESGAPIEL